MIEKIMIPVVMIVLVAITTNSTNANASAATVPTYEEQEIYYVNMGCKPVTHTDMQHVKTWSCPSGTWL